MSISSPSRSEKARTASSIERKNFEPVEERRVLIVDDTRLVRSVFFATLSPAYSCTMAESYAEALDRLKAAPFDLVITDVMMPGISGIELLRKIIDSYSDTTVIIVSGVDRPQRILDALRLGAFDYLIKPCDLDVLELAVERAFEHRTLLKKAALDEKALELRNRELELGKAELERLQTTLVQNEKMVSLGQIAAGIAHEINNPIAFVHGNLDMLKQTTSGMVDLLKYYESTEMPVQVIEKAAEIKAAIPFLSSVDDIALVIEDCLEGAERIKEIVRNLRIFSRCDEPVFTKTDINAGIESTVRLLSQYFNAGNMSLMRDYGAIPAIDAYGSQINQVWMNLLVNAAQAIEGGKGNVHIATSADDEYVTVTIADSGPGIALQDLSRIFDPFYTTKPIGTGTGLGLSICFGIIERHKGKISAASQLGAGTTFTVRLPIQMTKGSEHSEKGLDVYAPNTSIAEDHPSQTHTV
jgi:two-component system NtrC family sensor kinase